MDRLEAAAVAAEPGDDDGGVAGRGGGGGGGEGDGASFTARGSVPFNSATAARVRP
jgi:hypothetical protein